MPESAPWIASEIIFANKETPGKPGVADWSHGESNPVENTCFPSKTELLVQNSVQNVSTQVACSHD